MIDLDSWAEKIYSPTRLEVAAKLGIEPSTLSRLLAPKIQLRPVRCECGAKKCKSNIHSEWCPKYV